MILFFCESHALARSLRAAAATDADVRVIPGRLTTAAARAGAAIGRVDPELAVVCAAAPAPLSVVYRISVGAERWIPDVLFEHHEPAASIEAETHAPGATHDDRDPAHGELPVSSQIAATAAAAIALLGPARVVVCAGSGGTSDDDARRIVELARAALDHLRVGERIRRGGDEVSEAIELGEAIAQRLRLTVSQRSRFIANVRSAAIRGGVPTPLVDEPASPATTKDEAKARLCRLERALEGFARAAV